MKYHKQTIRHDPGNGKFGNCWQAGYASLLGLELEDVPHFCYDFPTGEVAEQRINAFLALHGLRRIAFPVIAESREELLKCWGTLNPEVTFLLGGTSRNGVNHVVIVRNGTILHDPSPTDAGITGPCDDGYYWLEFVGNFVGEMK